MNDTSSHNRFLATEDFRRARRQAAMEAIVARLTGRSADLLSYEEVKQKLRATGSVEKGYQEIPLDAIVGSVGRYTDFTRSFLPRKGSIQQRWANVKTFMTERGFDPIEVYKIGDAYFVKDGNHRVSIARQMGLDTIPAYVTEIKTKVPFSPEMQPDDLIRQAEYAAFLEETELDRNQPEAAFIVSLPGGYSQLEEQIEAHRRFLEQEEAEAISLPEAAANWYERVYLPVVHVIRQRGILRDFPGRTETDLYLWIVRHRAELQRALGWEVEASDAASDWAERASPQPERVAARIGSRIVEAITPEELDLGPAVGQWRQERLSSRQHPCLFNDVLVALSGEPVGWQALEQALVIAAREQGRLLGLHIVPTDERLGSLEVEIMRSQFVQRCQEAGVVGQFLARPGKVVSTVCNYARWTDLVVVTLSYPPLPQPLARLTSGFRALLRRCPRPVLVVPDGTTTELNSALLAYDGSPKAEEALYIATYLAAKWKIPLAVITVADKEIPVGTVERAQSYLEQHGVEATFEQVEGTVAAAILQAADRHGSEFILMGGYGFRAPYEVILGSVVDQVLRESRRPVLVSR